MKVVGDIVKLSAGDKVPSDGIILSCCDLTCNESSLTGEPEDCVKSVLPANKAAADVDPFVLSGTTVSTGYCDMLCTSVGEKSRWGKTKAALAIESEDTPLQEKLDTLAAQIGVGGLIAAGATFAVLMIQWFWFPENREPDMTLLKYVIRGAIMAVTIVVVAVPEGLPLAVTISLAYSTQKMMADNNLIRVLAACETMGNATNICSDKTGTLTQNRMVCTDAWIAGTLYESIPGQDEVPPQLIEQIVAGVCLNSTAHLSLTENDDTKGGDGAITEVLGNKTEGALLMMARDAFKIKYAAVRNENFVASRGDKIFSFNSDRKCMSALLYADHVTILDGDVSKSSPEIKVSKAKGNGAGKKKKDETEEPVAAKDSAGGKKDKKKSSSKSADSIDSASLSNYCSVYCKGAPEIILSKCTTYTNSAGDQVTLTKAVADKIKSSLHQMSAKSLRTVALAHRSTISIKAAQSNDLDEIESELNLDAIYGIRDPIRPDVPNAVAMCQNAGIIVRMVTGDNIETARAIARECGILSEDGICLEGPEFRKLTPRQLDEILPRLQVLARSTPNDKLLLVTRLNGHNLPKSKEEWETDHPGCSWKNDRDKLLPGHFEEWALYPPRQCGEVVGVTGDGTNDGPALKAADVGLSMGLTGTDGTYLPNKYFCVNMCVRYISYMQYICVYV